MAARESPTVKSGLNKSTAFGVQYISGQFEAIEESTFRRGDFICFSSRQDSKKFASSNETAAISD
ncbi:unnamed protein product [Protopolystoma xenopodis]|uniref:Uncharacterized protein n=1 Tax=Protopolystoma xenopodis TaxID=117903 RepID=A0A3S5C1N0_9PLAT|nr:unnamed protein product [Protopolystoma xenopodis]